jgi:hypothetical protein
MDDSTTIQSFGKRKCLKISQSVFIGMLGSVLLYSTRSFAFFNPADTAALTMIASNTAMTLTVLKSATELLELGDDTRKVLSGARDDADALEEFFQEISPEPGSPGYSESTEDLRESREVLNQVDREIINTDMVKWDAKYLADDLKKEPKRIGQLARVGTKVVRFGKKLSKFINRSAQDRTAYNTESMVYQSYINTKTLAEIKTILREQRNQAARERLKSVINTVNAIYAVMPDLDQEISERQTRKKVTHSLDGNLSNFSRNEQNRL